MPLPFFSSQWPQSSPIPFRARKRNRHIGRLFQRMRPGCGPVPAWIRSEEHTSELQSLMRISYAVFCLKKKNKTNNYKHNTTHTIQVKTHITTKINKQHMRIHM